MKRITTLQLFAIGFSIAWGAQAKHFNEQGSVAGSPESAATSAPSSESKYARRGAASMTPSVAAEIPSVSPISDDRFLPKSPSRGVASTGKGGGGAQAPIAPAKPIQFTKFSTGETGVELTPLGDNKFKVERTGKIVIGTPIEKEKVDSLLSQSKFGAKDNRGLTAKDAYSTAADDIKGYKFQTENGETVTGADLGIGTMNANGKKEKTDWYLAAGRLDSNRKNMAGEKINNTLVKEVNGKLTVVGGGGDM